MIDERNYEQPVTRQIVSDMHFLIDPLQSVYRTADIFLDEVEITTDGGIFPTLFPSAVINTTYTYNQEFREQVVFSPLETSIADFYFRKSQTKFRYDRVLGNVLTVLSYLGGIWSSVHIWFSLFAQTYSWHSFINCLSNKLYNYPSQMKKKQKKSKAIEQKEIDKSPIISPELNENRKSMYSKILDKVQAYLSYERKLNLSFCEMWKFIVQSILSFFKFEDEKYALMKKSHENITTDLDICNILKKLHEFDKIKKILFSDEQHLILTFSPKPEVISSEVDPDLLKMTASGLKSLSKSIRVKKNLRLLEDEANFDEIKPFKQLIFAWKTLKTTKETTLSLNKNLLNMLGEDFTKTLDITEDEMKMIFGQGQGKFMSLIKSLKANDGFSQRIKPKSFVKSVVIQSPSENFIDCNENDGRFINVGNKIEKVDVKKKTENKKEIKEKPVRFLKQATMRKQIHSKLNRVKDKLCLGHLKREIYEGVEYPEKKSINNEEIELISKDCKMTSPEMMYSQKVSLTCDNKEDFLFLKKEPPDLANKK